MTLMTSDRYSLWGFSVTIYKIKYIYIFICVQIDEICVQIDEDEDELLTVPALIKNDVLAVWPSSG